MAVYTRSSLCLMPPRIALFTDSDSDAESTAVSHDDEPLRGYPPGAQSGTGPACRQAHLDMAHLFAANDALAKTTATSDQTPVNVEDVFRYKSTKAADATAGVSTSAEVDRDGVPAAYDTLLQTRVQAYHGDTYQGTCLVALCACPGSSGGPSVSASARPALMLLRRLTSAPEAPPTPVLYRFPVSAALVVRPSGHNPQYVQVLDQAESHSAKAPLIWWSLMFPTTQEANLFAASCFLMARLTDAAGLSQWLHTAATEGPPSETLWLEAASATDRTSAEPDGAAPLLLNAAHSPHHDAQAWCTVWPVSESCRLGAPLWDGQATAEAARLWPGLAAVWEEVRRLSARCEVSGYGRRGVILARARTAGAHGAVAAFFTVRVSAQGDRCSPSEETMATAPSPVAALPLPAPSAVSANLGAVPTVATSQAPLADALAQLLTHVVTTQTGRVPVTAAAAATTAPHAEESLLFLRERVEALHDKISRLDVDARLEARNADLLKQIKQLMGLAPSGAVDVEDALKDRDALLASVEKYKTSAQESSRNYERALESIGRYAERVRALEVDLTTQKDAHERRVAELTERQRLLALEARARHHDEMTTAAQQAYERGLAEGERRGRLQAYEAQPDGEDGIAAANSLETRKRLQAADDAVAQAKLAAVEARRCHEHDRRSLLAEITVLQQLCAKLKQQSADPQIPQEDASAQTKRLKRALNAVYTNTEHKVFTRVDERQSRGSAVTAGTGMPESLTAEDFLACLVAAVKEESKVFTAEIRAQDAQRQHENTLLRQLVEERRATARLAAATTGPPPPPLPPSPTLPHPPSTHADLRSDTNAALTPPAPATQSLQTSDTWLPSAPTNPLTSHPGEAASLPVGSAASASESVALSLMCSERTTPRPTTMTAVTATTVTARTSADPRWTGSTSPSPPPPPQPQDMLTASPPPREPTHSRQASIEDDPRTPLQPPGHAGTEASMPFVPSLPSSPPQSLLPHAAAAWHEHPHSVSQTSLDDVTREGTATPPRRAAIQLTP